LLSTEKKPVAQGTRAAGTSGGKAKSARFEFFRESKGRAQKRIRSGRDQMTWTVPVATPSVIAGRRTAVAGGFKKQTPGLARPASLNIPAAG